MAKVIAIIEKPSDCQKCWFSQCRYSLPLSTSRKGYLCQSLKGEKRVVEDFGYDEEVHLKNCPLREVPQYKPLDVDAISEFYAHIGFNQCLNEILRGGE